MTPNDFQQIQFMLQRGRYDEAIRDIQTQLAHFPEMSYLHFLMAIALYSKEDKKAALDSINTAIGLDPDQAIYFDMKARILLSQTKADEAENEVREAVRMEPDNADFWCTLARVHYAQEDWPAAKKAAEIGLQQDGAHQDCLNLRSLASMKMNDANAAFQDINASLGNNPDNPDTHTVAGFTHLEKGNREKALEHFREALRISPNHPGAKAGLIEALKSKYLVYRLFLKYIFWMQKKQRQARIGIIIGAYIGFRIIRGVADSNPALKPFLMPLIVLYILFAWSTWVLSPLFNLSLMLNPYGRFALTKDERVSSMFTGGFLALGLAGGIGYLASGMEPFLGVLAFGLTIIIPTASMFIPETKRGRTILVGSTALMGALGIFSIAGWFITGEMPMTATIYLLMIFGYQWLANFVK